MVRFLTDDLERSQGDCGADDNVENCGPAVTNHSLDSEKVKIHRHVYSAEKLRNTRQPCGVHKPRQNGSIFHDRIERRTLVRNFVGGGHLGE